MDQLKGILKLLQKHLFWLLAVICMISGVVGWSMASKSLSAAYTQKKIAIEKAFTGLKSIRDTDPFPNSKWKDGIAKLTDEERQQVGKAWEQLYNEQKDILEWPKHLGDVFLDKIKSLPPEDRIPPEHCEIYAINIKNEIPDLLRIIGLTFEEQTADGARPTVKPPGDGKPTVAWEGGQKQIQELLSWKDPVDWGKDWKQVWLAQEDLWVYKAVLTVISNVNAGAEFNLPIPKIESLEIGANAAEALQQGMRQVHIDTPAHASGGEGDPPPATGQQPGGEEGATPAPDAGRYVDANGKPLQGGAPAKEPFKRMPVFMKLSIEQRAIPQLLAECANSPLPIEVRQLRMAPSKSAATSKSSQGQSNTAPINSAADAAKTDVPLELGGIIYIYNKPEMSKPGEAPTATADAAPAPPPPTGPGG